MVRAILTVLYIFLAVEHAARYGPDNYAPDGVGAQSYRDMLVASMRALDKVYFWRLILEQSFLAHMFIFWE